MTPTESSTCGKHATAFDHHDGKAWTAVRLPDFFASFLAVTPRINPHYQHVREESESWISMSCKFDERQHKRMTKIDFSYFCAIIVPDANPEELRTICDWGNWVFPFDDMFDNGELKQDSNGAHAEMGRLLEAMMHPETYDRNIKSTSALVQTHNSIWFRILERSSKGTARRFVSSMTDYCNGALDQVDNSSQRAIPDPDDLLATRRKSIGASPLFALIEYAYALDIPDEVFECKAIREIERIGIELVVLQNDALSYCKEQAEGINHNLVALYRLSGLSAQAAFDRIAELMNSRYKEWYLALAILPHWNEEVNRSVQIYIQGVQNVVLANLNWSFHSGRYFGQNKDLVRANGLVDVLPVEPIVGHANRWDTMLKVKYQQIFQWAQCYMDAVLGARQ